MSAPALEVQDLHAYYGESHVLQGVDLVVRPGEAVALIGRNGAGKTTTISAIAGFLRPRQGTVRINGRNLTGAPAHWVARAGVALVPQGRRIFGDLSVRENLAIAGRPAANGWDEARVVEQQMLAVGRALMRNPSLLLLDEPSEGLAPMLVEEVGETLVRLRATGLPLLLVEQNLGLATRVGQRVHVMNKGTIVFTGTPVELAAARDVEARYLGV